MEETHARLSGLDQSFLHFETPNAYMHVALTAVFDPGSLCVAEGGIDCASVRSHVASRLHLIPRYRQRLHYGPLASAPIWVDDADFDLDYHVRHSHLPTPGTEAQRRRPRISKAIARGPAEPSYAAAQLSFID